MNVSQLPGSVECGVKFVGLGVIAQHRGANMKTRTAQALKGKSRLQMKADSKVRMQLLLIHSGLAVYMIEFYIHDFVVVKFADDVRETSGMMVRRLCGVVRRLCAL